MSVNAKYDFKLTVEETPALSEDLADDPTIVQKMTGANGTLTASSTVPATKSWADQRQLSAGADSLDLTALVNSARDNIDMTGLKVQLLKIKAAAENANAIKFDVGSSNGYNIFGSATSEVSVPPGGMIMLYGADGLPDVAAGAKAIDISSSDVDAIYDIQIVAG